MSDPLQFHPAGSSQITEVRIQDQLTKQPTVEAHQKLADSPQVGQELRAKPNEVEQKGKTWIQENKANFLIGSGKVLMTTGALGSFLLAPLTMAGGILGGVAAKIAKE